MYSSQALLLIVLSHIDIVLVIILNNGIWTNMHALCVCVSIVLNLTMLSHSLGRFVRDVWRFLGTKVQEDQAINISPRLRAGLTPCMRAGSTHAARVPIAISISVW